MTLTALRWNYDRVVGQMHAQEEASRRQNDPNFKTLDNDNDKKRQKTLDQLNKQLDLMAADLKKAMADAEAAKAEALKTPLPQKENKKGEQIPLTKNQILWNTLEASKILFSLSHPRLARIRHHTSNLLWRSATKEKRRTRQSTRQCRPRYLSLLQSARHPVRNTRRASRN